VYKGIQGKDENVHNANENAGIYNRRRYSLLIENLFSTG
jgi:hypothetical protein